MRLTASSSHMLSIDHYLFIEMLPLLDTETRSEKGDHCTLKWINTAEAMWYIRIEEIPLSLLIRILYSRHMRDFTNLEQFTVKQQCNTE